MNRRNIALVFLAGNAFFTLFINMEVLGAPVRVYCRPEGVVFQTSGDDTPFTDENKIYDVPSFIVEESEMPASEFGEQYRCEDNSRVVVDTTIITPRIRRLQTKAEAQRQYDEELARDSPDVVLLMRLNRDVELIAQDNQEAIQRYLTGAPTTP